MSKRTKRQRAILPDVSAPLPTDLIEAETWLSPLSDAPPVDPYAAVVEVVDHWRALGLREREAFAQVDRAPAAAVVKAWRQRLEESKRAARVRLLVDHGIELRVLPDGSESVEETNADLYKDDYYLIRDLLMVHCAAEAQLFAIDHGLSDPAGLGAEGAARVTLRALVLIPRRWFPSFLVAGFLRSPSAAERAFATLALAGIVRTKLSTKSAYRFGRALANEAGSDTQAAKEKVLLKHLPGAVLRGLPDSDNGLHGDALMRQIVRSVAKDIEHELHPPGAAPLPPEIECFAAFEDAVLEEIGGGAREILREAKLTAREIAVCELDDQGRPDAEIAARLKIARGTVASTRARYKNKLMRHLRAIA